MIGAPPLRDRQPWIPRTLTHIPAQPLAWFLIALTLLGAVTVIAHFYSLEAGFLGFVPLSSAGDDRGYWDTASTLYSGASPPFIQNGYPVFLVALFQLLWRSLLLGKTVTVLAGALTVYLGVLLANLLHGPSRFTERDLRHPGNVAGLLLTLYPSLLFYDTQLLRDGLIVLLGVLAVYASLRLVRGGGFWHAALAVVGLGACYTLRPYATLSVFIGLVVTVLFTIRFQRGQRIRVAAILLSFGAFAPLALHKGLFAINYIGPLLNPTTIQRFRDEAYSVGGSAVGTSLDFTSPLHLLTSYLYSFITVLAGPFVWQVKAVTQLVAAPEAIVMLVVSIALVARLPRIWRQQRSVLITLVPGLVLMAVVAVFSDNVGANTRLRLLPWTLLAIAFAATSEPNGARDA